MIKAYYHLTKPGILFGNLLTATAGFFLASSHLALTQGLLFFLAGLALLIASACVINNYFDRKADRRMQRTKHRALALGVIKTHHALTFSAFLGAVGVYLLGSYSSQGTLWIALSGFLIYVLAYGILKYRSFYATLVGSLSGAAAPLAGYYAASGHLDIGAFLLFMTMALWQMPHFYSIAIYRVEDYLAAAIPVLPVKKDIPTTKLHTFLFLIAFLFFSYSLVFFHYAGLCYVLCILPFSLLWLMVSLYGFKQGIDPKKWARHMFLCSLLMILAQSIGIILEA